MASSRNINKNIIGFISFIFDYENKRYIFALALLELLAKDRSDVNFDIPISKFGFDKKCLW